MEADSNFSFYKNGNLLQKKIKMVMCSYIYTSNPSDSCSRTLENGHAGGFPSFNKSIHTHCVSFNFFPALWSLLQQYFPVISQQSFSSKGRS